MPRRFSDKPSFVIIRLECPAHFFLLPWCIALHVLLALGRRLFGVKVFQMSRLKALSTAESTYVCICKELNADVVLSGGTDISFQSVMNCEVCIRKELYAERRVVGGTAVFQGLLEPMTETRTSRQ